MKRLIIISMLAIIGLSVKAQWQPVPGPYGANIESMAVCGNRIFAGAGNGCRGMFISTDYGNSWSQTCNELADELVWSIAVRGDTMIAGTIDKLFMSQDSGTTWKRADDGLIPSAVWSVAFCGNYMFAATDSGVYKSPVINPHWKRSNKGLTKVIVITNPEDPDYNNGKGVRFKMVPRKFAVCGNTLYAVVDGVGVFVSENFGKSWKEAVNKNIALSTISTLITDGTALYAILDGIYVSKDKGKTWKDISYNLKYNVSGRVLTIKNDTLYYGTSWNGAYRKSKNDTMWTEISEGIPINVISAMVVCGNSIFIAYGQNEDGIYKSVNNGASWHYAGDGLKTSCSVFNVGTKLYATQWENMFSLSPDDSHFELLNIPGIKNPIRSIDKQENKFYLSAKNGTFVSADNGASWNELDTNLRKLKINSFKVRDTLIAANTYDYVTLLSGNSGKTFRKVNGVNYNNPTVYDIAYFGNLIFIGSSYGFYVSSDGGYSWKKSDKGFPNDGSATSVMSIHIFGNNIFTVTWHKGLYLSKNSGADWTKIDIPSSKDYYGEYSLGATKDHYYVATNSGIYESDTIAKEWKSISGNLPDTFITGLLIADSIIFVNIEHGLFVSDDDGKNWISANEGLVSNSVSSLLIYKNDVYAGNSSMGIWRRPLDEIKQKFKK